MQREKQSKIYPIHQNSSMWKR